MLNHFPKITPSAAEYFHRSSDFLAEMSWLFSYQCGHFETHVNSFHSLTSNGKIVDTALRTRMQIDLMGMFGVIRKIQAQIDNDLLHPVLKFDSVEDMIKFRNRGENERKIVEKEVSLLESQFDRFEKDFLEVESICITAKS